MKQHLIFLMILAGLSMSFTTSNFLNVDQQNEKEVLSASVEADIVKDFKCACIGTIKVEAPKGSTDWNVEIVELATGIVRFSTSESVDISKTIPGDIDYIFRQTSPGVEILVDYNFCGADGGWINVGNTQNVKYVGCT